MPFEKKACRQRTMNVSNYLYQGAEELGGNSKVAPLFFYIFTKDEDLIILGVGV